MKKILMLTIRLQRTGKRNQASFRIVLAEKAAAVNKKFLEILGSYNPRKKDFSIKTERLQYWLGQKVAVSPTVHNLLIGKQVTTGTKVKAFSVPKKPVEPVAEVKVSAPAEAVANAPIESAPTETAPMVEPTALAETSSETPQV